MSLRVQEIPAAAIVPSPHNPRQLRDGDPGVASLAESIKAQGLIQPITVRPRDLVEGGAAGYEIVAGERRWRACRLAGLESVPAIVRTDLDDQQALELIVTENLQREDLHPLEEAKGVASLLGSGQTVTDVADRLGKSVAWVARRSRLTNLSPKWLRLATDGKSPVSEWPARALELVARLEPASQDEFLASHRWLVEQDRGNVYRDVARDIADYTRRLTLAPWALDDATLEPKAGACESCPKRSSCHPGLFDEEGESAGKAARGADHCLDALCWSRKLDRHLARVADQLETEHGQVAFVGDTGYGSDKPPAFVQARKATIGNRWDGREAKKSDKGAVPVLHVSGHDRGKVEWRVFGREKAAAGGRGADKPKPMSLSEKRAKLAGRRQAHALDGICEAVTKAPAPAVIDLLALAAAFGTWLKADRPGSVHDGGSKAAVPLKILAGPGQGHVDRLWSLVARVLVKRWRSALAWKGQKGLAEHQPEIAAVAKVLGLDLVPFEAKAAEAIPEPKAWATEAAKAKPAKKAAGKRKAA